jgi:aryl-alcohol dehydrogenase-like predicted oxidoreductase
LEYRQIPGTNMQLSSLALGGWLSFGDRTSDEESLRILRAAVDGGVTFLDLADVYASGGAERLVGRFLREVDRQRLLISSKVFWPMSEDPLDRGLSRRHIHESIDRTLDRLGVDELDLYFCHREDPDVSLAETVEAMGDLVKSGKVRAWGTSCWRPSTLREAHRLAAELAVAPPRVEQPPYSLLERDIERGVVAACQALGMALVVFSPLAGGVLTGKYLDGVPRGSRGADSSWVASYMSPAATAKVRAFIDGCRASSLDPAVVALAWAMQRPGITSVITGASCEAQLRRNLRAAQFIVDESLQASLEGWCPIAPRQWWRRLLRRVRDLGQRR